MLDRVLEVEVMDTAEEATDYDAMDHRSVNGVFCTDFLAAVGSRRPSRLLDVGTGTALIPIELCSREDALQVVAIDLAEHMLEQARRNVERVNLTDRISLEARDAKNSGWSAGEFDAVISNSIVHHIPEPADALSEMWRLVRPGGILFVRDLVRAETDDEIRALVEKHAPVGAVNDARENRQRALFEASLRAALTRAEVQAVVMLAGINNAEITITSDRHWTLVATRPLE